jgi:hypothetical protein
MDCLAKTLQESGMPIDLAKLLRDEDIGDALGHLCELEIQDDPNEPVWFTVQDSRDIAILARDGSGGMFFTVANGPRIIHASSEGEAGVIGSDIDEFLAIIVTCPYWRDLLHASGGGSLEEMRRAHPVMEAYWLDEDDDNEAMREHLMVAIGITPPDDLIAVLHRNIATQMAFAHAQDGSALQTLFGNGTIDRNPFLKPYMD